jgi:Flp pilus assembly pilin Flp
MLYPCKQLPSDDQGLVYTEYLVILTLVSLGVTGALIALGVPLLNLFLYQQAVVLLPFP